MIFDSTDRVADLHINVGIVFATQEWVVWHNPAVIRPERVAIVALHLNQRRLTATVFWIAILNKDSLFRESLWKALLANTILHAG